MKKVVFSLGIVAIILLAISVLAHFLFGGFVLYWSQDPRLISYILSKIPQTHPYVPTEAEIQMGIFALGWAVIALGFLLIPGLIVDILITASSRDESKPNGLAKGITLGVLDLLFGSKFLGVLEIIEVTCFETK